MVAVNEVKYVTSNVRNPRYINLSHILMRRYIINLEYRRDIQSALQAMFGQFFFIPDRNIYSQGIHLIIIL